MLNKRGMVQIGPSKIVGPYTVEHGYGAPEPKYFRGYEDEDDFQADDWEDDEDDVWKVIRRG
jgi:hypothetical protein